MVNFWRSLRLIGLIGFCVVLSGILTACTTTYDAPKVIASSGNDAPVQGSDKRASIRLQLGISYLQQDQLPTALKELNNAISIEPTLADAYGVRALVYMQMHENTLAEQDFQRVMQLAPNNPDHLNNYAWFMCQNGREKQSMELFDRVIKDRTYTQPVKALNDAGLCSLKMKDSALAETYFLQAQRFDAGNATTNLNLARINYKKADWTHAQFYANRLIKAEAYTPEILWLAIKISHKLNDQISEASLVVQLRRRFPDSDEYAAFQRGAYDE